MLEFKQQTSNQTSEAANAKPVVAVDVDEVLGKFVSQLAAFHNEAYGTSLTLRDFHSYHFRDVWGGTDDEATTKVSMIGIDLPGSDYVTIGDTITCYLGWPGLHTNRAS